MPTAFLLDFGTAFLEGLRATTGLEWVAVLTGFACVWLAAREKILNFPVAIVSCALYMLVYHRAQLYSDRNLQVLFVVLSLYGWYEWLHGGRGGAELQVSRTRPVEWAGCLLLVAGYTAGYGYYLRNHTDASLPYLDSLTTAISIAAQFLLMRKRLENWLLWILVDLMYVPLLWYKQLYPTSILYALYLALAAYGYRQWQQHLPHRPQLA
ncbi:nicotinamide riboside transporter PnuC [Hymenobacter saemangeumensis]|uniref:Nicotinamide riboside transporter PnuC n=1 Tax=Hymenobacter saemangeumensis TaxID=1084522 RepID=A0ABP8IR69_9BACT